MIRDFMSKYFLALNDDATCEGFIKALINFYIACKQQSPICADFRSKMVVYCAAVNVIGKYDTAKHRSMVADFDHMINMIAQSDPAIDMEISALLLSGIKATT